MAQYEFQYAIFRDDNFLADSVTSISLAKKDIKALEDFIVEHEYSPLFVDIPAYIYDKCEAKAWDMVPRLCKEIGDSASPDGLELAFSDHMPLSFIDALEEDIAEKVYEKLQEIHPEFFTEDEEEGEEEEEIEIPAPCKENTLYLPIKQVYFDQIMDGSKTEEYRVIQETTYKKYLEVDEEGFPLIDLNIISEEDLSRYTADDAIYIYNHGECPLIPKENLWYLSLAVGYNKVRDTALVQVTAMDFRVAKQKDGSDARYNLDEEGQICWDPDGEFCVWEAVLCLGDIVEKNIVSKK